MRLLQRFDDIGHVIFHIDTYDDEEENFCRILPLRKEIEQVLADAISPLLPHCTDYYLTLHYLHDLIEIELKLGNRASEQLNDSSLSLADLNSRLNESLTDYPWFSRLSIWQR